LLSWDPKAPGRGVSSRFEGSEGEPQRGDERGPGVLQLDVAPARDRVRISPDIGAPADIESVTFGWPLCTDHAHLLRLGSALTRFRSDL
jgi:hypothetical protein